MNPNLPKNQENDYEKLMPRIQKIKDEKLQQKMEDENDELMGRFKVKKMKKYSRNWKMNMTN